jgi:hypothetical protein
LQRGKFDQFSDLHLAGTMMEHMKGLSDAGRALEVRLRRCRAIKKTARMLLDTDPWFNA